MDIRLEYIIPTDNNRILSEYGGILVECLKGHSKRDICPSLPELIFRDIQFEYIIPTDNRKISNTLLSIIFERR